MKVRVYDIREGHRLVAAIEIVSPSNKDHPEPRRAFVSKCAALLRERVSVAIVDRVTNRTANLHRDLLEFLGGADPSSSVDETPIYAVACRTTRKESEWLIENWMYLPPDDRPDVADVATLARR